MFRKEILLEEKDEPPGRIFSPFAAVDIPEIINALGFISKFRHFHFSGNLLQAKIFNFSCFSRSEEQIQ